MLVLDLLAQRLQRRCVGDVTLVEMHVRERVELRGERRDIHRDHPRVLRKPLHHLVPKPAAPAGNQHELLLRGTKLPLRANPAERPVVPCQPVERLVYAAENARCCQYFEDRDEFCEAGDAFGRVGEDGESGLEGSKEAGAQVWWAAGEDV